MSNTALGEFVALILCASVVPLLRHYQPYFCHSYATVAGGVRNSAMQLYVVR